MKEGKEGTNEERKERKPSESCSHDLGCSGYLVANHRTAKNPFLCAEASRVKGEERAS